MNPLADCRVTLMHSADLPAYKALRDAMLAGHPEAFTSDAETELQRDADSYRSRLSGGHDGVNLFTLLAWQQAELVGAISCEQEARIKVRHIALIVGMMVRDDVQGRGVGRQLLQKALQLLRGEPLLELVTLSVTSSNRAGLRLYQSCGFQRYGCLPRAIKLADGRVLDKDLMSLTLERVDAGPN